MADRLDAAWIVRTQARARPKIRLFCFPYAGGGASLYRNWSSKLPVEVEVCAIQLPGRESRFREPAFSQLEPLIEKLAQELRPAAALPFAFFGYSLGALISFELTRYLRHHQMPGPKHLFVAAHRAPQMARRTETIHGLYGTDFIQALHRLGGTPQAVLQNQELMEMMSPMLRADFQIYERYDYKNEQSLACPITAYGGALDRTVSESELAGWSEQTSSTFQLRMLPGGHFFLQDSQDLLIQSVAQGLL